MKEYLDLCQLVLDKGHLKNDRTNTGTISYFGFQTRYDLSKGFPLLTTKKVHLHAIIHELLWFIKGETNIQPLVKNNVKIWNEWPYQKYCKSTDYQGESLDEFVLKIKDDDEFASRYGDLGPVYGKQWRSFVGSDGLVVDQLKKVMEEIKSNPTSRRLIVNAWHPAYLKEMALPPCHLLFQFYVNDNRLSCLLYQRSADIFLGVPFNIASYALLTMMMAKVCNLEVGDFVHTIGDAHIYLNHLEQVKTQLSRQPRPLPQMIIHGHQQSIFDFKYEDFELSGYLPYPAIKGKVAV